MSVRHLASVRHLPRHPDLADKVLVLAGTSSVTDALYCQTEDGSSLMESVSQVTREDFERLLDCLAAERDVASERYSRLRETLIDYFTFERCPFPEDHADEVMMRVARRLSQGERIERVPAFMLGVARVLAKEVVSRAQRAEAKLREFARIAAPDSASSEVPLVCLDRCLDQLPPESRELILEYYGGEPDRRIATRKSMAKRYGIDGVALRNRALRVRQKLESCVGQCLRNGGGHP
ncbi:MAG: sigma-70 family RNA polymerase sigma factor [Acidobacteria bacterium]|nr:sigma-70 family RNA polymerase sigma factor [Acidobacteriota bacterium]